MQAAVQIPNAKYPVFNPITTTVSPVNGSQRTFTIERPSEEEVNRTAGVAKEIFVNAFTKKYREYHTAAKTEQSIEEWLRLKTGVVFKDWLETTFDEELQEYRDGKKGMIYLTDEQGRLVAWLSHSAVDEKGDVYLSQCSLEAESQDKKIASTAFAEVINTNNILTLFPGAKKLKLIARKVNTSADHLYIKAGFKRNDTITPSDYGASYDDRYVGYQKDVS